jgi:hypothetical protein
VMRMKRAQEQRRVAAAACLGAIVLAGIGLSAKEVRAQFPASRTLATAEDHFLFGEYQEALLEIDTLLETPDLDPELRHSALILKGRCLVKIGIRDEASAAFCQAHLLDPSWQPAEGWDADELAVLDLAQESCVLPRSTWQKIRYYVLGGAVIGAAVGLVGGGDGAGGGDGVGPLPDFPPMPAKSAGTGR